jgi:hypothetical protein
MRELGLEAFGVYRNFANLRTSQDSARITISILRALHRNLDMLGTIEDIQSS